MTARTGLGLLELAALEAVAELGGVPTAGYRKTARVLDRLEREHGIGARYAYPLLLDLTVPWRLHLPLLDMNGNVGSQHGDPPADARYMEVRLSPVGALALAAERGEIGPVPLGLVDGSLYRDGPVPPFDPRRVVSALLSGSTDVGPPVLPTGGVIAGDIAALIAGRAARLELSCEIHHEPDLLVITAVPLGVDIDRVEQSVLMRARAFPGRDSGFRDFVPSRPAEQPFRVVDVQDETSMRVGVRVVVRLSPGSDAAAAEAFVRTLWPVTTEVDCRLPEPMARRLRSWDAGDGTGLAALEQLLR